MKIRLFFVLSMILCSLSCSFDSPEKRLKAIEAKELAMEQPVNPENEKKGEDHAESVLNLYLAFVEKYPQHEMAPEMIYRAAMVQADRKQRFMECIALFERIRREYPEHRRAENALFLIGYTYAEQLKNFEQAKTYYEAFLQQYPTSDLSQSVEFELQNLGKPVEELEIIKNLTTQPAN